MEEIRGGGNGPTLDFMLLEQQKAITITSAATTCEWNGMQNLLKKLHCNQLPHPIAHIQNQLWTFERHRQNHRALQRTDNVNR
jgi:translation elongation factor EF-G